MRKTVRSANQSALLSGATPLSYHSSRTSLLCVPADHETEREEQQEARALAVHLRLLEDCMEQFAGARVYVCVRERARPTVRRHCRV